MNPERIGPYIIEHKIGSGGMGTVYLAHHADSGKEVALKVLPPALAREEGFVARFEREIEALRKLINPNIVTLLDSGADESTPYYAMEFVEGETLTDRLRREKRLPWRDVVQFALQICSALKSAHDAGIIHRDLKPSNLLLDKDNNIKLTDFGVAQVFAANRLTMQGAIIGTAEYMSPEQAHGRRATKKSDLYSLGAVMFTMLTGRPPFSGKTTLEVIHKHKYGTFDRPSRFVEGIPRRLEEIVCQLLEKEPDDRFPDALVLSRRLEELVRRADVADQEETRVADSHSTPNAQSAEVHVAGESRNPINDVGGTLVRDLVRADIEQTLEGSALSKFFNNTWVLLGLFVLLLAGGYGWFQYINRDAEIPQESDVNKILRVARVSLESQLRSDPSHQTAPLLHQAIVALEVGDAPKAERLLNSIQYLIDGQDGQNALKQKVGKVLESLQELNGQQVAANLEAVPERLLQQAESLWKAGDKRGADMIWMSIIDVYEGHPEWEAQVQAAKQWLKDAKAEQPRNDSTNSEAVDSPSALEQESH